MSGSVHISSSVWPAVAVVAIVFCFLGFLAHDCSKLGAECVKAGGSWDGAACKR